MPKTEYHLDFGDGAVQSGYDAVTSSTVYSIMRGYGFTAGSEQSGMERVPGDIPSGYDNLYSNQILGETSFRVDLPEGKYSGRLI